MKILILNIIFLSSVAVAQLAKQHDRYQLDELTTPELFSCTRTEKTDDPLFAKQWAFQKMQVSEALTLVPVTTPGETQKDILVAIIDTGMNLAHPDLKPNLFFNLLESLTSAIAGKDDDQNGFVDDVNGWNFESKTNEVEDDFGHGTHIAGIIGAVQNNRIGVAGIAPHVKILPIKWMDKGSGWGEDAIASIHYAVKMGARVINASWGGIGYSKALDDAVKEAENKGILFVASAGNKKGNNDVTPRHPANLKLSNVISVANTNENDELDPTSNFGSGTVDLAAPGVNIESTMMGSTYDALTGTSMAAAEVSGVAALLLAIDPLLTAQKIKEILIQTGDVLPSLQGKLKNAVRINAAKAARLVSGNKW